MRFWTTALTLMLACMLATPGLALAEPTAAAEETQPYVILDGKSDIEKLTDAQSAAQANLDDANAKAEQVQTQIDELEAELPHRQHRLLPRLRLRQLMMQTAETS